MSSQPPSPRAAGTQLAYQPARYHPLTQHRRALVAAAVLIALAVAGAVWGPRVWNNVQLLYWQSRCLHHEPAFGQVAAAPDARRVPREWSRFYQLFSPPGMSSDGTAFLGERVSPSGARRLVVVDVSGMSDPHGARATARVFVPGTWLSRPRELVRAGGSLDLPAGASVVVGRADAKDRSHFTFLYRSKATEALVDGWLRDDDTILLEVAPSASTASGRALNTAEDG